MQETQSKLKSWALWLAIAALIAFAVLNITGVNISEPVNMIMTLALPVLVGFGIINDPTVHDKLFGNGEQKWYQSWALWLSVAALITYCVKLFFKLDIEKTVNDLMNVLLPVLVAFGVVNNPTSKSTL